MLIADLLSVTMIRSFFSRPSFDALTFTAYRLCSRRPRDDVQKSSRSSHNGSKTRKESSQRPPVRSLSSDEVDFIPISLIAWCKRNNQLKITEGIRQVYAALGHAAEKWSRRDSPRKLLRLAIPDSSLLKLRASALFSEKLLKTVSDSNMQIAAADDFIHRVEVTDFMYRKRDSRVHESAKQDSEEGNNRVSALKDRTMIKFRNFMTIFRQIWNSFVFRLKRSLRLLPLTKNKPFISKMLEDNSPAHFPRRNPHDWCPITLTDVQQGKFDLKNISAEKLLLRVRCRMTVIPNPRRFYANYEWCFNNIKVVGATGPKPSESKDVDVLCHYRHMAATYLASNPIFTALLYILPKPITLDASMILRQNAFIAKRLSVMAKGESEEEINPSFTDILPSKVTSMEIDLEIDQKPESTKRNIENTVTSTPRKSVKISQFVRKKILRNHTLPHKHFGRWCQTPKPQRRQGFVMAPQILLKKFIGIKLQSIAHSFRVVSIRNDESDTYPMWCMVDSKSSQ